MQETAFIWDLDGTVLDSYEAILSGIEETFAQFSIPYDKEKVREFILKYSVQDLLVQVAEAFFPLFCKKNHFIAVEIYICLFHYSL